MSLQGMRLGALALFLLIVSGVEFYREWNFGNRAVEVSARISGHDSSPEIWRQGRLVRANYYLAFTFAPPGGEEIELRRDVSMADYLKRGVGDQVTVWVDPANPRGMQWHGDDFAIWGLMAAMAGMVLAALSALSFGTAIRQRNSGRDVWTGVAFPWLRYRG